MNYKRSLATATICLTALISPLFSSCSQPAEPSQIVKQYAPSPTSSQAEKQYNPSSLSKIELIRDYKPSQTEVNIVEAIKDLSSSQSEDRKVAEDYVLKTYGNEIGKKAINLSKLAASNKEDIVLNAVQGNPYSIEALQQKFDTTSPYVLSSLIDYMFNDVPSYDTDEKEMKEFGQIADDYEKARKEHGMPSTTKINPNLKAFVSYSWVFLGRSAFTGNLWEAHRYAWAVAKNPKTRDAGYDVVCDIYYDSKKISENSESGTKKDFNLEILKEKAREKWGEIKGNIPAVKKEAEEKIKQQAEEFRKKVEEQSKSQQTEAKKRAEEEARKKLEELEKKAEDKARRGIQQFNDWLNKYKK